MGFEETYKLANRARCSMSMTEPDSQMMKRCLIKPFERVFEDLAEPRATPLHGGVGCIMFLEDEHTRHAWTYFLKDKTQVPAIFRGSLAEDRANGCPVHRRALTDGQRN